MIRSTEQTLFRLDNLNTQQQRISYQMSTGKKLEYGSDDSNLYTREVYVDDKIRVYEGLKVQIQKTTVQNNTSDSTLKEAKNLLTYVKAEVIKALNGTTDDDAKDAIAVNLRGVKENLFDLANESIEGEYLYGGSDTQIQPFVKDENGKISYAGDGLLRKVAVEDGAYRERGITGFETFMYTAASGLKGENLEFDRSERILDQDSYEWKFQGIEPLTAATDTLNIPAGDTNKPLVDNNGTIWTFNGTDLSDGDGNILAVTPVSGGYDVVVPSSADPLNPSTLGIAQLVRHDEDGNATTDTLSVSNGIEKSFVMTLPLEDGTKFESKANTFDVMDKIINALESKDIDGKIIDREIANEFLKEGLGEITEAFEAANVGHAKLGGRNKVFELSLERVSSKLTQFNILSQELGAADLSKVAVEAKALELTYTALYSTINKMNELSLVNFLR